MDHEDHWQRILKFTAYAILAIAVVFVLKTLRGIFVPLMLSVFVAYLFAPAVETLAKIRIPRILSFFILLLVISAIGFFLGRLIVQNAREFVRLWPTYESKLLASVTAFLKQYLSLEPGAFFGLLESQRATKILSSMVSFSFAFIGKLSLTLLVLIFFYLSFKNYPNLIRKAFDQSRADHIFTIVSNINEQIINYVIIKTFISVCTGIFTGVATWLFGVKYAALWGTLAFVLNYIPYIGSFTAAVIPTIFALLLFPGSMIPLFVFLALFAIQLFWGSFLDPEMMSNRFNLSPIVIIMSLVFWSYVWGIMGAFLAVPTTAIIKIILQNIEPLKVVATLMSKKAD